MGHPETAKLPRTVLGVERALAEDHDGGDHRVLRPRPGAASGRQSLGPLGSGSSNALQPVVAAFELG
jgi:hypothetical protein